MDKKRLSPKEARDELAIFDDLQRLCCSSAFIHAIAYFCWRDNIIHFVGNKITENDVQHRYSHERLLRTEISTLLGLMAKTDIDVSRPHPNVFQSYIDQSESLLHEMHMSLQKPWMTAFAAMARDPSRSNDIDIFSTADGLREPIFYGGESAYNFQYGELAQKRYTNDNAWLQSKLNFSIEEACIVARELGNLQMQKLLRLRDDMRTRHPDQWTFLPGFNFCANELENSTGFSLQKIESILNAFTIGTRAYAHLNESLGIPKSGLI